MSFTAVGGTLTAASGRPLTKSDRDLLDDFNPTLYLDARNPLGIGAPRPADGTPLATWVDLSGNGWNVTQATATKRPLFRKAGLNGRPAVQFDGVDDVLVSATAGLTQPGTVYVVGNAVGTDRALISGGTAGSALLYDRGNTFRLYAGTGLVGPASDDAPHCFTAVYNNTTSALYLDGVQVAAGPAGIGVGGNLFPTFSVGGQGTEYPLNGHIAAILVFPGVHDAYTRNQIQKRLSASFGTTPPPPVDRSGETAVAAGAGTLLFDSNFANSGLSNYLQVIHPERVHIENDPILGSARKVARLTVFNTDTGPTENPRAQLESPKFLDAGEEVWIGWSTLFPDNWPDLPSTGWVTFQSVYGPPYEGEGPNAIGVVGGYPNQIVLGGTQPFMPFIKGRWIDFCIRLVMSSDPAVGLMEVYTCTDDTRWVQRKIGSSYRASYATLKPGVNDGGANDCRINLYRKAGIFDVMTLFHAGHRVGTTFETVAPRSYPNALRPWE